MEFLEDEEKLLRHEMDLHKYHMTQVLAAIKDGIETVGGITTHKIMKQGLERAFENEIILLKLKSNIDERKLALWMENERNEGCEHTDIEVVGAERKLEIEIDFIERKIFATRRMKRLQHQLDVMTKASRVIDTSLGKENFMTSDQHITDFNDHPVSKKLEVDDTPIKSESDTEFILNQTISCDPREQNVISDAKRDDLADISSLPTKRLEIIQHENSVEAHCTTEISRLKRQDTSSEDSNNNILTKIIK